MTVVSRRIAATPARSASSAWAVIVDLIAPTSGSARTELQGISGIASSLISDEAMKADACVVYGSGPRLRVYCVYDEDAVTGENTNEAPLTFNPTAGDWQMSLPCQPDDLEWVQNALTKQSTHVLAREIGTDINEETSAKAATTTGAVINREAFFRS
jgi:hypothetical protein